MVEFKLDGENVNAENRKLVDDIVYLRGRIITSYAQVEFLLADIAVKLELKFPYLISARLKAVKRIAEREGYEHYKTELEDICDGLERYDDIRKFMAHGWANLEVGKGSTHRFELLMYQREGDGEYQLYRAHTSCEQLLRAAEDINAYTGKVIRLFGRIYSEKKLEG